MSPGIGDDDEEYLKRFVTEFLPELPDHVVWSIVNMLPPEYIFDFLLYLPDSAIRDVLKDQLYNKQLHLLLLPRTSSYRKELVTVSPYVKLMGYFEITQFLRDNEDLNPAKLACIGWVWRCSFFEEYNGNQSRTTNYKSRRFSGIGRQ